MKWCKIDGNHFCGGYTHDNTPGYNHKFRVGELVHVFSNELLLKRKKHKLLMLFKYLKKS